MKQILFFLKGLIIATLIYGCTAYRIYQPRKIDIQGDYKHKMTQTSFPMTWDRFIRESITTFNKDSSDIGVNYTLNNSNQDLKASVYVYPAPVAIEQRLRDEYFKCLQDIATVLNQGINTTPTPLIISRDGDKVLGLIGAMNSSNYKSVLVLFECGKYFLKYRISSSSIDTSVLISLAHKMTEKFSPIEIVKKQPLIQRATIHIAPGITTDTSCLYAIFAAALAKSKWVYENVDSFERCSGFPSLYFEEQKVSIDSMLNRWAKVRHNNTRFDKYFNDLAAIKESGFINEFICDQYCNTLQLPDSVELNLEKYKIWKKTNNPTVKLVGQYYYIIGYEGSYQQK